MVYFSFCFLLQAFINYGTAGEGGDYFNNSSLLILPSYKHLDISRVITADSSPLHIASGRTQAGNPCFRTQVTKHQVTHPQIMDLIVMEVQKDNVTVAKYIMNVILSLFNRLFSRYRCQLFSEP